MTTMLMVLVLPATFWIGWGPEAVADVKWWCMRARARRRGWRQSATP